MILFYLDGMSTSDIAKALGSSETAVRQRLFSARKKLKNEVETMTDIINRPANLTNINFEIWGNGNPNVGDPRDVAQRQFSKHIVWLCRKKPMSASEIAEELNVPTVYVEEELEILARGADSKKNLKRLRISILNRFRQSVKVLHSTSKKRKTNISPSPISTKKLTLISSSGSRYSTLRMLFHGV